MACSTNSKCHANTVHLEIRKCSFSYYVAGATSGMVVLVLDKKDAPKHDAQREDDEHGEHSALIPVCSTQVRLRIQFMEAVHGVKKPVVFTTLVSRMRDSACVCVCNSQAHLRTA